MENSPPLSTSQKWSSIVSAASRACSIHEPSPVASASRVKRVDDCRVVRGERGMARLRLAVGLPRPMPTTVVAAKVVDEELGRWRPRPSSQSARSSAAAASASEASISPFHSVSTLSSSSGRRRCARASNNRCRADSTSAGRSSSPRCRSRAGIVRPSKLPPSVNSYHSSATSASAPSTARTSSVVHVWKRPSWPWPCSSGESASSAEKNPPDGMAKFAQHVLDGLLDDLLPTRLAEHEVGVEVDADQQRLVVQHLLEVGHEPLARRPSSGRSRRRCGRTSRRWPSRRARS